MNIVNKIVSSVLIGAFIVAVIAIVGIYTMDIWAPYAHRMSPEEIAELQRIAETHMTQ